MSEKIVVCGAGGYVGGKLVEYLLKQGHRNIRAVSSRPFDQWLAPSHWGPWFPDTRPAALRSATVEAVVADLRNPASCVAAVAGADWVYNLAAKVGGIGFIGKHKAECMMSSLVNTNLLKAISESPNQTVKRYFFASSSCVYPAADGPLAESAAYPAQPSEGYGWDKLFSEKTCLAFAEDYGIPVTIARYHTIYGPGDVRTVEKDHVTAALCNKVIAAKLSGNHEINIWGDGTQTRSFLYINDCVEGTYRLATQGVTGPVNLANSEPVSVNDIVSELEEIAGVRLTRFYSTKAPVGLQHKVTDNKLIFSKLRWEPSTPIREGLRAMYADFWDRAITVK